MFLLVFVVSAFQLACNFPQVQTSITNSRNSWYGPSYHPSWWTSDPEISLRNDNFGYDGPNGPDTWHENFLDCGGLQQSPINIRTADFKKKRTKKPLKWSNYYKNPKKMIVENSGHSIHFNGIWKNSSDIPYISEGPLVKQYFFSQIHFHWGKNSHKGSEHTVNKKSFPLEMHVVHDSKTEDSNILSEEDFSEGLVVVAFMFEIVKHDNPSLKPILDGTQKVQGSQKKKAFTESFAFDDLFDTFGSDYVCYKGSLTTPPCTEGVIWIISSKPIGISHRQLRTLRRSVLNQYGETIANSRPVQNVNGRNIYYVYC